MRRSDKAREYAELALMDETVFVYKEGIVEGGRRAACALLNRLRYRNFRTGPIYQAEGKVPHQRYCDECEGITNHNARGECIDCEEDT